MVKRDAHDRVQQPQHGCVLEVEEHLLAEKCARDGRYAFMFSLLPLVLERGTASPANPVALF